MHLETKKICVTCFITILALLWWSGVESKISLRYACTFLFLVYKSVGQLRHLLHFGLAGLVCRP